MIALESCESPFGTVTILQSKRTGSLIYSQGDHFQSETDSKGVSLASYVHALFGLVLQSKARHVLMIGCGGGSLATMLNRANRRVTIVDINPCAFELAHRHFCLPHEIACHVADGRRFLLRDGYVYDAIVLDAYHGDRIPVHLRSLEFFRLARKRLNAMGCILANVHVDLDLDESAKRVADCMSNVWPEVRVLDAPGKPFRNAIVSGGNVEKLTVPSLIMPPATGMGEIITDLESLRFRI